MTTKHTNIIFYLIVAILFYLLNRFSFMTADDFSFASTNANGNTLVTSITDVILTQVDNYKNVNGRFIVNIITQIFAGIYTIEVFQILNTIVFVLLCFGISCVLDEIYIKSSLNKYLAVFALFILMPIPGQIFLGPIAHTINYLWSSCIYIWFLYLYYKIKGKSYGTFVNFVFLFCGILSGSFHDSWSIGLGAAFFFYYCLHRKELNGSVVWLTIGFEIGTCILVFAPGNFIRVGNINAIGDYSLFVKHINNLVKMSLDLRMFYILFLTCCYLIFKKREILKKVWNKYSILFLMIFINLIFFTIAYSGPRQIYGIELLSLLIVISIFGEIKSCVISKNMNCIKFSIVSLLLICYVPAYSARKEVKSKHDVLIANIITTTDGTANAKEYYEICLHNQNWFMNQFAYYTSYVFYMRQAMSLYFSNRQNESLIRAILPQSKEYIINLCTDKNKYSENIYKSEKYNFYVLCLPELINLDSLNINLSMATLGGKLRNKLLGKKEVYNTISFKGLEEFDYFYYNGKYYVVVFYKDSLPILKITYNSMK